jgi:RimJ/RimL family protein N-acetyltransferase
MNGCSSASNAEGSTTGWHSAASNPTASEGMPGIGTLEGGEIPQNMPETNGTSLFDLSRSKFPLRYGIDSCYMTLTDDRYTQETIQLRNTPSIGKFIHFVRLSPEDHERWLAGQLERDDALNFVLIVKHRFAATLSLYNIEHGKSCEFGRVMMPNDGRRMYALAGEMLGMSFAFEVLGVQTLYCVLMEENRRVLGFLLKSGWKLDPRYDGSTTLSGSEMRLIGLSIDRAEWPAWFAKMQPLAQRFLQMRPAA